MSDLPVSDHHLSPMSILKDDNAQQDGLRSTEGNPEMTAPPESFPPPLCR